MATELTVTTRAAAVDPIGGPLSLADLAALCLAAASLCDGVEGRGHDLLTATDTVRDRVGVGTGFPELAGIDLGEESRVQVAAALCRAVYGRVSPDPITAAERWQDSMPRPCRAEMLGRMLTTAAAQLAMEAAHQRAALLLGTSVECADADHGRA